GTPAAHAAPAPRARTLGLRPAARPRAGAAALLQRVTDAEAAPVAAVDVHRHRQVEHDLPGIAAVHLQPVGVGMGADAAPDPVAEDALGAVADQIARAVAGQRLAEAAVVGGHVAVGVGAD